MRAPSTSSANKAIILLSAAGDLPACTEIFNGIAAPDAVSWNSILTAHSRNGRHLEVLRLFSQMLKTSPTVSPTPTTLCIAVSSCSESLSLLPGRQLHAFSLKAGFASDVYVGTSLLSLYSRCRFLNSSLKVFEEISLKTVPSYNALIAGAIFNHELDLALQILNRIPERNLASWSIILKGLASEGRFLTAVRIFKAAVQELGFRNSDFALTLPAAVLASWKLKDHAKCGRSVHGWILKLGFGCDSENLSLLIRGYLENDLIEPAVDLFSEMANPTVQICTGLVTALVERGRTEEASALYDKMLEKDAILTTAMVDGYMRDGMLREAMDLFKTIPDPSVVSYNVLLSGLISRGKIEEARDLFFGEMLIKDEVSYSTMTSGLVRSGRGQEALNLLKIMMRRSDGARPNESVVASVASAAGSISALGQGESIHGLAVRLGFEDRVVAANALISMYGKCGEVEAARSVFDNLNPRSRDLISWNSVLHGYAVNGRGVECFELYDKMKEEGIEPDDLTFLAILTACVHNRRLENSKQFLHEMRSKHGINPRLPHYSCLVELLCKLGRSKEAEELVRQLPFEADSIIWSSILSGCAQNLDADLAKVAADRLLEIDPLDPTPRLSLARIDAANGRISDSRLSAGRKIARPGNSWIEIGGKICCFFAGDKSLSQSRDWAGKLEYLLAGIKFIGREKEVFESEYLNIGEIDEG